MPVTRGLSHLNLNVSDVERSVRFYQQVFGLEVLHQSSETIQKDDRSVEVQQAILRTPGTNDLLALTQASSFPIGSDGLNHFGFIFRSNDDVRDAVQLALQLGAEVIRRGEREQDGILEVFAYIRDPDGYAIELCTQEITLRSRG